MTLTGMMTFVFNTYIHDKNTDIDMKSIISLKKTEPGVVLRNGNNLKTCMQSINISKHNVSQIANNKCINQITRIILARGH